MTEIESFERAHVRTLPARIERGFGPLAAGQARDLPALALRLPDGSAWRYAVWGDGIALERGDDAPLVVELAERDWQGLYDATETVMGLVMSRRAKVLAGGVGDFVAWDTPLRVLYEELPPFDPKVPLVDRNGRELDPRTDFAPDDDPARMAEFLRVAGYIVVRQVVPRSEVDELLEAAERARSRAVDGDRTSWWSDATSGERVLVRVLDGRRDPRLDALPADPRLMRIVALSEFALEATPSADVSLLYKRSGLVFDGKADQPWHRDCGLGGHKLMCPLMNGSLFLKSADRTSGELRFLPGSWRTAGARIEDPDYRLGVGIEAEPGDFSLHYGEGLHAGTPPTAPHGPFRWSAVFEYGPIGRLPEQSQDHYDQLMHEADARRLGSRG